MQKIVADKLIEDILTTIREATPADGDEMVEAISFMADTITSLIAMCQITGRIRYSADEMIDDMALMMKASVRTKAAKIQDLKRNN